MHLSQPVGDRIICEDPARTMTNLAEDGVESFYNGKLVKTIPTIFRKMAEQ